METKTFLEIAAMTEGQAREHLEAIRWGGSPACPHCGLFEVTRLMGKATRPGVFKCKGCRKQFTVTVGTIFERSHIPLKTWLLAFHLMCASKKGISALQLKRQLGIAYKSAWHMAHRIRYAMAQEPLRSMLSGTVEVDEGYIGGKPRRPNCAGLGEWGRRSKHKVPVMVLVERGGRARALALEKVTAKTLRGEIARSVDPTARVMTDDCAMYRGTDKIVSGGHEVVKHTEREYVRKSDPTVYTNTAECFIGLAKRAVMGAWHHISRQHVQRYMDEMTFRWDRRGISDAARTAEAIKAGDGKRLMYQEPTGA